MTDAMSNPQRDIGLLLPLLSWLSALTSQGEGIAAERKTGWKAAEGREARCKLRFHLRQDEE
jgi:hypothetical protein